MRASMIIAALGLGASAFAQMAISGPVNHYSISLGPGGSEAGPIISYSNVTNGLGFYFPGHDMGDGLMMTQGGLVNGFTFGYYDPAGNTALTTLDVWFHDDIYNGCPPGNWIKGLVISGLPGDGAWIITVDLQGSGLEFMAPQNMWMSLGFKTSSDSPEAGWLLYDPPTVGASGDFFWSWTDGACYWFGGNPVANFCAEIAMVPEPGTIAALAAGLGLIAIRRKK